MADKRESCRRVLIGIVLKNTVTYLARFLKIVEKYMSLFGWLNSSILLVDGHSTDGTFELAEYWCALYPSSRCIIRQRSSQLSRMESLCEARNTVIDTFRPLFGENVYLLLLDADSPNCVDFDTSGFLSVFSSLKPSGWTAVFPTQKDKYYDVFALRDVADEPRPDGHPLCLRNYQIEMRELGCEEDWAYAGRYMTPYPPTSIHFRRVRSAFGGAALYNTASITLKSKYEYKEDWNGIWVVACEHVAFNESLGAGALLYINTKWCIGEHT